MNLRHHARHALPALASLALVAAPAAATELHASAAHVSGIVVHDAAETLRDYCHSDAGRLYLELPDGSRWELVTSATDPAISNPGDGAFHAFEPAEVASALDQLNYPLRNISAEVYILPFPLRASLESAAGPGLILLSPGVRSLSREHQHSEFVHELGHVVQYALLPDADSEGWARYASMRGLQPPANTPAAWPPAPPRPAAPGGGWAGSGSMRGLQPLVNTASAAHADRPHEIWAEDFRALFGGAAATSAGTIENASLAYPTQVAGLDRFMASLAASAASAGSARLMAAPLARGAVSFSRFGTRAAVLDVFDAARRRLASVAPAIGGNAVAWNWDGTDRSGLPVRGAVVFARARDGQGGAVQVVIVR